MKSLMTLVAALSISTAATAAASVDPAVIDQTKFVAAASTDVSSGASVVVQSRYRYRGRYWYRDKCTEDLGYGRTGTYGCG